MVNVYTNWVGRADLDGFRIDTVKHVDYGFWDYWCPQLHSFATSIGKSNFFMFGEVFDGSEQKCGSYTGTKNGGAFTLDSVVDYPLFFAANSVFATASGNTKQIEDHYGYVGTYYDPAAQYRLVTFLDNHDQPRFLSSGLANNNTNRLAVALTFLYTSRGIPCLYYGTEQAFNGSGDPNNREDMWDGGFEQGPSLGDNFNETHPLFRLVAQLNNFRRVYPALRNGAHRNLWNSPGGPGPFAYARTNATEELVIVFNTSASSQTVPARVTTYPYTSASSQTVPARATTYPDGTVLVNLLNTNETITVNVTNLPSMNIPSMGAKIFVAQSLFQPLDPVVTSIVPAHGATNVPSNAAIVLGFSKPMDTNSVQAAFSTTPPRAGSFTWNALRDMMTFTPSAPLGGTTNNVRIATNAFDNADGKFFFAPFESYFVTSGSLADTNPPTVFISTPVGNATLTGTVSITGTASDNIAVSKVEVQLDGGVWTQAVGTTSWSLSLDTTKFLNGAHVLTARATDGGGNVSSLASVNVKFFNVPGSYLARISPGNPSNATDCATDVWVADKAYALGSFGYSDGNAGYLNNSISNVCSTVWPLYQRERYSGTTGSFRYLFDCPAGIYETTLLEAETWTNVPNGRVFNAFIEGQQVLTNFDIFATTGGKNIPITLVFTNAVTDAQLEMLFSSIIDNARASGIQVRKIADLDTDGDGIPDWWMLGYFDHPTGQDADNSLATEDADGDGMSNLQEFLADTNPLDINSALRITAVNFVSNDIQVSWTTRTGKNYRLQSSPTPDGTGNWTNLNSQAAGTGGVVTQNDLGAVTNSLPQFYRVRLVP
jgi:hypothetical protein